MRFFAERLRMTSGRAWKPAPTTGRRVVAPYAQIAFLFFNRNGQDRSLQFFIIHFSLFIHFRVAESSPPTLALQFVRSVIHSKSCGGGKILRIRALCGGGKPPPYPENFIPLIPSHKPPIYILPLTKSALCCTIALPENLFYSGGRFGTIPTGAMKRHQTKLRRN